MRRVPTRLSQCRESAWVSIERDRPGMAGFSVSDNSSMTKGRAIIWASVFSLVPLTYSLSQWVQTASPPNLSLRYLGLITNVPGPNRATFAIANKSAFPVSVDGSGFIQIRPSALEVVPDRHVYRCPPTVLAAGDSVVIHLSLPRTNDWRFKFVGIALDASSPLRNAFARRGVHPMLGVPKGFMVTLTGEWMKQ